MQILDSRLDRIVVIEARPATVFSFFTDNARWAQWWGAGSTIDPRPGGRAFIRHPNGVEMAGEVLEIEAPNRIVFTYGYVHGGLIPEGGSRVTIQLEEVPGGTRLHLTHEFADEIPRDHHVQGWRYQLALFSNAVATVVNADAPAIVDGWFEAWNEPEAGRRHQAFARVTEADVEFRDQYGFTRGVEDLVGHTAAVQKFMPGTRIERAGGIRLCQGRALSDWLVIGADGAQRGRGTNAFVFGQEGRIVAVTGFWSAPPNT
jgi:uncharacterized protein YndB with AHSA1/START domain